MERELGNGERGRKQRENEEMQRVNLSPFPHFLSISSSFPHSLSISSQPGCQAATICATLLYIAILVKNSEKKPSNIHMPELKGCSVVAPFKYYRTGQVNNNNDAFLWFWICSLFLHFRQFHTLKSEFFSSFFFCFSPEFWGEFVECLILQNQIKKQCRYDIY